MVVQHCPDCLLSNIKQHAQDGRAPLPGGAGMEEIATERAAKQVPFRGYMNLMRHVVST